MQLLRENAVIISEFDSLVRQMASSKQRLGQVRIIAGHWRGSRLPVIAAPGLRPSHDRVRETVFNWLNERLAGSNCLDLFAGTGALGFEAASRGARSVTLVDSNPLIVQSLRATAERLGGSQVEVLEASALNWLARQTSETPVYDLVFVDPPYGQIDYERLFELLESTSILDTNGWIYFECERKAQIWQNLSRWQVHRARETKTLRYVLLARENQSLKSG